MVGLENSNINHTITSALSFCVGSSALALCCSTETSDLSCFRAKRSLLCLTLSLSKRILRVFARTTESSSGSTYNSNSNIPIRLGGFANMPREATEYDYGLRIEGNLHMVRKFVISVTDTVCIKALSTTWILFNINNFE